MSNVLYLEDNAKFLVNRHSAIVDDFGRIAKEWDEKTLRIWLDTSRYAANHLGYHCQVAHSPSDVVMLCDMAVELGWMVNITIATKHGASVRPLPQSLSSQLYAVKSISQTLHKLYMRVDLGQSFLNCLVAEDSGVLVAGSTVEYPNWLQQVKGHVVELGQKEPDRAFMAMVSYSDLYRSWESGQSPKGHVDRFATDPANAEILKCGHNFVRQLMSMHPDWKSEYALGYATFLAGADLTGSSESLLSIQVDDFMRGWNDAKKVHEMPFLACSNAN